jgi:GGDEF domain-containing protein
VLLPVNLVLLTVLPDRGFLTVSGIMRMTFVLLQVGGAIIVIMTWPEIVAVGSVLAPGGLPAGIPATPLSIGGLAVFGMAIVILAILAVRRSTPLEAGTMVMAVAILAALHLQDRPDASSVMIVAAGAALAVTLLQNGYRLAFVDELTNLPGRRALEMEMSRLGGRYVVAMLDIDHFKSFNDTYGHDIGDEALRMVASHIRLVGGGGKPFRYGGEEFTVVFPGMNTDEAAEWLEDLRADIEGTPFRVRDTGARANDGGSGKRRRGRSRRTKSLTITISIGLADRNDKHKTPEHVIKAADKALYRAKEKGRNQISK